LVGVVASLENPAHLPTGFVTGQVSVIREAAILVLPLLPRLVGAPALALALLDGEVEILGHQVE
jgi:hypothetical protein